MKSTHCLPRTKKPKNVEILRKVASQKEDFKHKVSAWCNHRHTHPHNIYVYGVTSPRHDDLPGFFEVPASSLPGSKRPQLLNQSQSQLIQCDKLGCPLPGNPVYSILAVFNWVYIRGTSTPEIRSMFSSSRKSCVLRARWAGTLFVLK